MRDLASRLRAIVSTDRKRFRESSSDDVRDDDTGSPGVLRELTYVPDLGHDHRGPLGGAASGNLEAAAAALGGTLDGREDSAFIAIDRVGDPHRSHGRRKVGSYVIDDESPIGLFDNRVAASAGWASRIVFFDIETTGLSGGAGMLAFLVGCGWFEPDGGFRVRQFFLAGPGGESAMLDALARIFGDASLLVTFNGRTFDVPVMDMRWAFHRKPTPADGLAHFDMLPPARRLWSGLDSCSLSSLERSVLGFHRLADVPGLEIPARYFHFLRTGDVSIVDGVLEHNRHDLISLAAVTAHALTLAAEGPEACAEACEQVALGRLYERAGDAARAVRAYELAASSPDREMRVQALSRLAVLLRREERYDESMAAWRGVFDLADRGHRPLTPLERRAAEALAIHHEHRARDLETARRYAEVMRGQSSGRFAAEVEHRLGRIDRKLRTSENTKGGPMAARLLDD